MRSRLPQTATGSATREGLSRRRLLAALRALRRGELSARLPDDLGGVDGEVCAVFNALASAAEARQRAILEIARVTSAAAQGDLTQVISLEARGEIARIQGDLNEMIRSFAQATRASREQEQLRTQLTRFARILQGQHDLGALAREVLAELAPLVGAQYGVFYLATAPDGESARLRRTASYADPDPAAREDEVFALGQGLVGQAALDRKPIVLRDLPPDYVRVGSALGGAQPASVAVLPVVFEGKVKGVIELASLRDFTPAELDFLQQLLEGLGSAIAGIDSAARTAELLRESQGMAQELRVQQAELRQTNEELEAKARQLLVTSRYKSQFLANMSHELRTPLNSLLILSRQLAANERNLSDKQIEYARTIHQSGTELLALINEILDLAKIESGTMAIDVSDVVLAELRDYVERSFQPVAEERRLAFQIELDEQLPHGIRTDDMRLRQVLRNLLSNAFKFTEQGGVRLRIFPVAPQPRTEARIGFAISDTGIGIAQDKQSSIFEAFQQADGGTSRKYGGTGLGLAISREIARLLGGEIGVSSTPGAGSTFTLYLPIGQLRRPSSSGIAAQRLGDRVRHASVWASGGDAIRAVRAVRAATLVPADAAPEAAQGKERSALIAAGDGAISRALLDAVHGRGYRGVLTHLGEHALELARVMEPELIALDLELADVDGLVLLDQLKRDPRTRHIPVHAIGPAERERRALEVGAQGFARKPVADADLARMLDDLERWQRTEKRSAVLVFSDAAERSAVASLVGPAFDGVIEASRVQEVLEALQSDSLACAISEPGQPGSLAAELQQALAAGSGPAPRAPILVFGRAAHAQEDPWRRLRSRAVVRFARSEEQLIERVTAALHRHESQLPQELRDALRQGAERDPSLAGRTVLVVDDDVRNLFALTALLEEQRMHVLHAETGKDALRRLEEPRPIDVVLMDIMMPELDGYETTRRIRAAAHHEQLPIIALTAQAMKGDREKCLAAGASDYIAKPVDADRLISLLRVWAG